MAAQLRQPVNETMQKKLHVDPSTGEPTNSNLGPSKDRSPASDAISCISSAGDANGSVKDDDANRESLNTDQGASYPASGFYGYYAPGSVGSFADLDNEGYYVGADVMDFQYPVMQADNGSLFYLMPGFQPGYATYFPINTVPLDGIGQNVYPSGPMFQHPVGSPGYYSSPVPYGDVMSTPYLWNSPLVGDGALISGYHANSRLISSLPNHTGAAQSKSSPSETPSEVKKLTPSVADSSHVMRDQMKPGYKAPLQGSAHQSDVLGNGYFSVTKIPAYNQGNIGFLYPNNFVNMKATGKGRGGNEKLKTRSKFRGNLNEQSDSPRTASAKGAMMPGGNTAGSLASAGSGNENCIKSLIRKDMYNLSDFPTKYDHAFFFVIKSYSEDDIHKSIKYNVWASTSEGNKRLDTAYKNAQARMAEKGSKCPVFLLFSVNASGQFCGVAEMVGPVDFNRSMDFWQQDKWNGYFPVKWHIIKDVPNSQLRHIILENNDHKPVTNSRDTQEVHFHQGIEMLYIFKNTVSRTSIFDDFEFYEGRQKVMQEKRMRQYVSNSDFQRKADALSTSFKSMDLSTVRRTEETKFGDKTRE